MEVSDSKVECRGKVVGYKGMAAVKSKPERTGMGEKEKEVEYADVGKRAVSEQHI